MPIGRVIRVINVVCSDLKKLADELNARVKELEDFHDLAVGRELEMVKLEEEVERLKRELET